MVSVASACAQVGFGFVSRVCYERPLVTVRMGIMTRFERST